MAALTFENIQFPCDPKEGLKHKEGMQEYVFLKNNWRTIHGDYPHVWEESDGRFAYYKGEVFKEGSRGFQELHSLNVTSDCSALSDNSATQQIRFIGDYAIQDQNGDCHQFIDGTWWTYKAENGYSEKVKTDLDKLSEVVLGIYTKILEKKGIKIEKTEETNCIDELVKEHFIKSNSSKCQCNKPSPKYSRNFAKCSRCSKPLNLPL